MVKLNYFLIVCIVLLFLYDLNLSKKLGTIKKYRIENIDFLLRMIKKLSKCMNGQVLAIEYNNIKIMELIKYQKNNLWGIELLYDLSNKENNPSELKDWLIKKGIIFEHKVFNKDIEGLVIDCKNNLNIVQEVFYFILHKYEKLSSDIIPRCYFLKTSIES